MFFNNKRWLKKEFSSTIKRVQHQQNFYSIQYFKTNQNQQKHPNNLIVVII